MQSGSSSTPPNDSFFNEFAIEMKYTEVPSVTVVIRQAQAGHSFSVMRLSDLGPQAPKDSASVVYVYSR